MTTFNKIAFTAALSLGVACSLPVSATTLAPDLPALSSAQAGGGVIKAQFQTLQGNGAFTNFTIDIDNGKMVAEDFSFEGLTSRNDLFEAQSFKMRNVVIEENGRTSRIGDLVMQNVTFTIPAGETIEVLAFLKAVASSNADVVIINDVDLQTEDGNVKFAEVRLENLKNGIIGLASMNGMAYTATTQGTARIDRISTRNLNAGKLVEIFDDAAYGASGSRQIARLLGELEISGVSFEDDTGARGTITQVRVNEIRGKQFAARPSELAAVLEQIEQAENDFTGSSAEKSEWFGVVIAEAIQSDGMKLAGISIEAQDETSGTPVIFSLEDLTIGAGDLARTPPMTLRNMAVSGVAETGMAFAFKLAGIDLGKGTFLTAEGLEAFTAQPPSPDTYQDFAQLYRRQTMDTFSMSGLTVAIEGQELVSMPEMSGTGAMDGGYYSSNLSIPSIKVFMNTVAALGAPQPILDQLGYEVMDFSLEAVGGYDANESILSYEQFDITLADGGTLGFSGTLSNLPEAVLGTVVPEDSLAMFLEAGITDAVVFYEDNSLANRLFELAGTLTGSDAATMKAQVTAGASFFALQLGDPTVAQQVSAAVATFVEDPQSLTISVAPEEPVSIISLDEKMQEGPAAVIRALNLEVFANE